MSGDSGACENVLWRELPHGGDAATIRCVTTDDETRSTAAVSGREIAPMIDRIDLVVIGGPDSGRSISATTKRVVVGTADGADLVLTDPTVSRFHCELVLEAGRPIIRDLGSKNGTLIDGIAVFAAPLADGAVLTFGKTRCGSRASPVRCDRCCRTRERFGALVGRSLAMRSVFALLERAAGSDVTVLLRGRDRHRQGARGAHAIHQREPRARTARSSSSTAARCPGRCSRASCSVTSAARSPGADRERIGAFEARRRRHGVPRRDRRAAASSCSRSCCACSRAKTVQRVGGSARIPVDVRVIAATHRDLRAEVNTRRFRSDLYYRLAVLEITLPPLRERTDDIPMLVAAIARGPRATSRTRVRDRRVRSQRCSSIAWPGNVRELRNHVERAAGIGRYATTASEIDVSIPLKEARTRWVQLFESRYLAELLQAHGGNVSAAARAAGIDRVHFYRLLGRAGLR